MNGFSVENEYHFVGNNVNADGSDRTKYPPFKDEPKKGKPPKKSGFNWGKLAFNVCAGLAAVALVTFLAVEIAAAIVVTAALAEVIELTAAVAGTASVVGQAVSDIRSGEVSGTLDYIGAGVRETVVGAVSGAVLGPFGSSQTVVGKLLMGGVTNAFESCVRQTIQTGTIDPLVVVDDFKIGIATAGIFHGAGKGVGKGIELTGLDSSPWLKKGAAKISEAIDKNIKKVVEKAYNTVDNIKFNNPSQVAMEGVPNVRGNCFNEVDNGINKIEQTPVQKKYNEITGKGSSKAGEGAELGNKNMNDIAEETSKADNWLVGKNGDVNWKSKPNFGHTFETYGAGKKNTKSLMDRARGKNQEQGQWLDNEKVAELLNSNGKVDKVIKIDIPEGFGQVITKTGEIIPANRAIIVPSPKGKIKTAYPIK